MGWTDRGWEEDEFDFSDLARHYFVYGTLRPQCGNARVWASCGARALWDGEVFVDGWVLRGGHIPYAERLRCEPRVEGPRITGAVILPPRDEDDRQRLRMALDTLEGHPRHYKRIKVPVRYQNMTFTSWMYDGSERAYGPLMPTGDYYDFVGVKA